MCQNKGKLVLPISGVRDRLIEYLRRFPTTILIADTGSGKTTQVPQFLFESGLGGAGVIAVTQPRRVAAVTVATRVAQERDNSPLGGVVGYAVRFDDCTGPLTRIKYATDGLLLREAMCDPELLRYSVVVLDEAHERTLQTDVLFGVVKTAQSARNSSPTLPDLKLIVMSATMDVDHFSQYFSDAPVLFLSGRSFPVRTFHSRVSHSDYALAALSTVVQLHRDQPPGDILLFLTGQDEIESVCSSLRALRLAAPLLPVPLYAALAPAAQLAAFVPPPRGSRKVVVATNIAETSITIPGIKYVVDSGVVKVKTYIASSGLEQLVVERVSRAAACQRAGRAGRDAPGSVYRLYTEAQFLRLLPTAPPAIRRANMSAVVLELVAMGIRRPAEFDFIDPPVDGAIDAAVRQLLALGAVVQGEQGEYGLTDRGRSLSQFPLLPEYSAAIVDSAPNGCLGNLLNIISVLSVDNALLNPANQREEATAARRKFQHASGDLLSLSAVMEHFLISGDKRWCKSHYLNRQALLQAEKVRCQLLGVCEKLGLSATTSSQSEPVCRSLCSGLFQNAAVLYRQSEYRIVESKQSVSIHPSSNLFHIRPKFIIFTDLVRTSKSYMRNVCAVEADWLIQANPRYFSSKNIVSS